MKKKRTVAGRTLAAVLTAVILFVITFFLHFVISIVIPAPAVISDWEFVTASAAEDIAGRIPVYKVASRDNPVAKPFGQNYVRLHYTVPSSSADSTLTLTTAYNPMRVVLDGTELLNDGYGTQNYTGACTRSFRIAGNGNDRSLDIFLYAPLAFDISATLTAESTSLFSLFSSSLGFAASLSVTLCGIALFTLTLFLSGGSRNIQRLLFLSVTILVAGITAILYSVTRSSDLLAAPYWYPVTLASQYLLSVLAFASVLFCSGKALRQVLFFLPALAALALPFFFSDIWVFRGVGLLFALLQLASAVLALRVYAGARQDDIPEVSIVMGLLLFAALIGVYNGICLILGFSPFSGFLAPYGISLLCVVSFVVFCRQVVFLDVKKSERIAQIYKDSAWIEGLTGLISRMFVQKDEESFLTEISKSLSTIIERNAESEIALDIHSCIGISQGDDFQELYNDGDLKDCRYAELAEHLSQQEKPLLIGNTTVDMMFVSDQHRAVIHFENILCGLYGNMGNIIRAAYGNLSIAYRNLNLKKDMSTMQEELFIHLAQVVEQRSSETKQHQIIVSAMVYELCRELGMNEDRSRLLSMASMAHDIGKIAIPETILEKHGQLDAEEREAMKKHTSYGYNILSIEHGEFFDAAASIALQHHENYDGTGYNGIKGHSIDPGARIVHVIDVFEALLSKRSYKEAWSPERAVNFIAEGRGTMFDPVVVDAFLGCSSRLVNMRDRITADTESQEENA